MTANLFMYATSSKIDGFKPVFTDLKINGTRDAINFIHLTHLLLLHYLVKLDKVADKNELAPFTASGADKIVSADDVPYIFVYWTFSYA